MSLEKKGSNKYIKLCYYEPLLLSLLIFYLVTYFGESWFFGWFFWDKKKGKF